MGCVVDVIVFVDYMCDLYIYVVNDYVEVVCWCVVWVCDYEIIELVVGDFDVVFDCIVLYDVIVDGIFEMDYRLYVGWWCG